MSNRTIYIILILLFPILGWCQNEGLVVNTVPSQSGVVVSWYPSDAATWKTQIEKGYRIYKTELDTLGNIITSRKLLMDNIKPKDINWFGLHSNEEEGLMEPIGALLYDQQFDFPESNGLSADEMKYNYIVYESTLYSEIALAVGLAYADTNNNPDVISQYEVEAIGNDLSGSFKYNDSKFLASIEPAQKFTFPQGKSLSDMLYESKPFEPKIVQVLGRAYQDSIVLRWGPSTPNIWRRAMKDGYEIYRAKGSEDRELIKKVYPWTEEQINALQSNDSLALLASSMILDGGVPPNMEGEDFYEKAVMSETYHGFALFSADLSPLAADILGLRYTDVDVVEGSFYTYWVKTESATSVLLQGNATVENVRDTLQAPAGVWTRSGEKSVTILWRNESTANNYTAYYLERSEDNSDFERITETPLVFVENEKKPIANFSYLDSVGVNHKKYYYRLYGANSFGELSLPAEIEGEGKKFTLPPKPILDVGTHNDTTNQVTLYWSNEEDIEGEIYKYQVHASNYPDGDFSAVSPYLDAEMDSYIMSLDGMDTDRPFYYKVSSVDLYGNTNFSLPLYVFVPDYTAPEAPLNVRGLIDSTGKVEIIWDPSTSSDVTGYNIYWGNENITELLIKNDSLHKATYYSWDVETKSLNNTLYVGVRAQDDNYNKSVLSEVIRVKRPDQVAPSKPFLNPIENDGEVFSLNWIPSISLDVVEQRIYVKNNSIGDTTWTFLDTVSVFIDEYAISDLKIGQDYAFSVMAVDDSGNESEYSNFAIGTLPFPSYDHVPYIISAERNTVARDSAEIKLVWNYKENKNQTGDVTYKYDVFRSVGSETPSLVSSTDNHIITFFDTDIQPGVLYNYAVRVRFENGWIGELSEVKSVLLD